MRCMSRPVVFLNSVFIMMLIAAPFRAAFAEFHGFDDADLPALPLNWSGEFWSSTNVPSVGGQPDLGNQVLLAETENAWLISPAYMATTNSVVDFRARFSGVGSVTVSVVRVSGQDGSTNAIGSVSVSPNSWGHFTLFPESQFVPGETNRIGFALSGLSGGSFFLDSAYFGRGLRSNEGTALSYTSDVQTGISEMWYRFTTDNVSWTTLGSQVLGGKTTDVFRADTRFGGGKQGDISPYAQLPPLPNGNFVAEIEVLNTEGKYGISRNDSIELRLSTNDWVSSSAIGDRVYRYDPEYPDATWRTVPVSGYIDGLEGNANVRIGLRAYASGNSESYVYFRHLNLDFMTTVDVSSGSLRYADWNESEQLLSAWDGDALSALHNDNPYGAVDLMLRPPADISNLVVRLIENRASRGDKLTHVLTNVVGTSSWRTQTAIGPLEAGEVRAYRVECEFESVVGRATNSPVYYPGPGTNDWLSADIGNLGSVWINEIGHSWVELAAPVGREILTGWSLEANSGVATQLYSISFSVFSNAIHHGIAFEVQSLSLDPGFTNGTLSLLNSADVVEFSVPYALNSDTNLTWGAMGAGPYISDNDFSSYGSNFTWSAGNATVGGVNSNQGIEVPVVLNCQITTTVAFAQIELDVDFSAGNLATSLFASVSGLTPVVTFDGEHTSTGEVDVSVDGVAFGWRGQPIAETLQLGDAITNMVPLELLASVGEDDFSGPDLKLYWEETIASGWFTESADSLRIDTRYKGESEESQLGVANAIRSSGKRVVSLEGKTRHLVNSSYPSRIDRLIPLLGTNSMWTGVPEVAFPPIQNQYDGMGLAENDWVHYRATIFDLQSIDEDLFFALKADPAGNSGKYTWLDDLRLSFHDAVTADNLRLLPAMQRYGQLFGISIDLTPQGESVSMVTAAFHYRVNGITWQTNSALLAEAITLTTPTNVTLSTAMGPFAEGDLIEYYVSVSYDPDDGGPDTETETRFYPDNSTIDEATGASLVIGDYVAQPRLFTVQGIPPVWFNEINPNPEITPGDHFVELAGWTNVNMGGYQIEVKNLTNGVADVYTIAASTFATNNITDVYGFYVIGGVSASNCQQELTNALPRHGGLKLFDSQSNVLDAVSYDAEGDSIASNDLEYVYLGNAAGDVLAASGTGNPGNQAQFTWASVASNSAGAFNAGQLYTNTPPTPNPPLFVNPQTWVKTTSNLVAQAEMSTDMHTPVEYRIQASGQDSGWSTAREFALTNLNENTAYALTLSVKDALDAQTDDGSTNVFTSVSVPTNAPIVTGIATNAVTVHMPAGAVVNLGVGDSSVRYMGDVGGMSAWSTGVVTVTDSAMTPNGLYEFEVKARNGDAEETAWSGVFGQGYTLAAVPVNPPVLTQEGSSLSLSVTNSVVEGALNADGNPTNTQYAIAVWVPGTSVTNYLTTAGEEQGFPAWAVLPDWGGTTGVVADVDTTLTNVFALLARNGTGDVTRLGPAATSVFNMEVAFAEVPAQLSGGEGQVSVVADIKNPWMNDVQLNLAYSSDADATWSNATLVSATAAYGTQPAVSTGMPYQISGVDTGTDMTNRVSATWNALGDMGDTFDGSVSLRWNAFDPDAQRTAQAPAVSNAAALDLKSPTGVITRLDANPTNAAPLRFRVVFSESVSGFSTGSLTNHEDGVSGTIAAVVGSGTTYTVTVSSVSGNGNFGISIPAGEVSDGADNGNIAVSQVGYEIDQTPPTGTITLLDANPTGADTLHFLVVFSDEGVFGFTTGSVSKHEAGVTGIVDSVIGSGTTYTVTVASVSGDGTIGISVAADACSDSAGNGNTALLRVDYDVDQSVPQPGTAFIGGGVASVILSLTNLTLDLSWQDFADNGNPPVGIEGYYYSLQNRVGTSEGLFTTGTSAVLSNVPRGVVTGFVWAVDQVGNIGTNSASDSMLVYYEASAFAVTGMPTQIAGTEQVIEVRAIYDENDTETISDAYVGPHEVTFSGAGISRAGMEASATDTNGIVVPFGDAMNLNFDAGIANATMRLVRAESAVVSLSDGVINADSNSLSVWVQPAEKATLFYGTPPPTQVVAGVVWSDFTVEISDTFGNKTVGETNNIAVYTSPSSFTTNMAAVNSTALFTGLTYTASGTIQVYAKGLIPVATAVVEVVVLSAEATSYVLGVGNSPVAAGTPVSLIVDAKDDFGNQAAGYAGVYSLIFSGALPAPSGTLPTVDGVNFGSSVSLTFDDGSANGSLALYKEGLTPLSVTNVAEGKVGGPLNVPVTRAPITEIEWKTQPPTNVAVNTLWNPKPEVLLRDAYHNPVKSSDLITLTPSKGAGISGASVGADGTASFNMIYSVPGVYRVSAMVQTLPEGRRYSPWSDLVLVLADTATPASIVSAEFSGSSLVLAFTNELFTTQHQVESLSDLPSSNWTADGLQVDYELDAGSFNQGSGEVWRATVELPATNRVFYRIATPEPQP